MENIYLSKDYIDSLNTMTGNLKLKYMFGQWIALEDAVYPTFEREKNVKDVNINEIKWDEIIVALDYGFTNQTAALLLFRNGNEIYIHKEYYRSKRLNNQITHDLENWLEYTKKIIIDPSAASTKAQFSEDGWQVEDAWNKINEGIEVVNDKIGRKDIIINPNCIELIKQIENYQYKDKNAEKPVPIKINDHLNDAMRYGVCHWFKENYDNLFNRQQPFAYFPDTLDENIEET